MDQDGDFPSMVNDPKGYELSGKIMLSAVIILVFVVFVIVGLHLYTRWYLLRARQVRLQRRRNQMSRRTHIVFYVDNHPTRVGNGNRGLEPSVLNSLPVFDYSAKDQRPDQVLECPVCLSEFEDNEKYRVLPKCKHAFHVECIDMWFHSHSNCPLCRSAVEAVQEPVNSLPEMDGPVVVPEDEPGSSSSSGVCTTGRSHEGNESDLNERRGLDLSAVRIEVPKRTELENELALSSSTSLEFRSPGNRLLSKILSMGKKSPTSAGVGTSLGDSCGSELDLEGGLTRSRVRTI